MRVSMQAAPSVLFAGSALLVVSACAAVLCSRVYAMDPELAAAGVTFDLTITVPALYWVFVVRTGRARALSMVPVAVGGTMIASVLIPSAHGDVVRLLRAVAVPIAEGVLGAVLLLRVRRAWKERSASSDPCERIHAAARSLFGEGRLGDAVASEMAMMYYATIAWRRGSEETRGTELTFHQQSGWGSLLACVLVLLVVEGLGMHLLLSSWSPTAAWICTGLDLWGACWLLGDYRALCVRRSFIADDALHLRFGMRWSVTVPRALIASIETAPSSSAWKRKDVLKVAILGEPRIVITLREPVVARGLMGSKKTIRAIALLPDQEDACRAALGGQADYA